MELGKSFMSTGYSTLASNLRPTEQTGSLEFLQLCGRLYDENAGMQWYSNLTFEITHIRLGCSNIITKEIPH